MQQRSQNFQEALKAFSKVLSKTPNDKVVYIARGVAHQDMGNHAQAIKDFN
jgi:Flp pilus assembly protein TadD